ncbi:hypothetical protein ASG29_07545 [Sphingomonas sp. Leaf412]|uniref:DUF4886 domain-containing protein n=1 Tax=Sphingomonas sp. Leaf412 TaxID=1736370 RepID=UPI0006F861B4|nr:DUF4886 domain-containing protein [Sphingomonas sp. Leaf412]KQT31763.1 hypothetical protein ASG29_07545 [Sphingomonas sp. Leaf412]
MIARFALPLLALVLPALAAAQGAPAPVPAVTPPAMPPPVARTVTAPRTILFVGNSFTYGALTPVERFRPDTVIDLNGTGVGGVPALFKAFTVAAGLDYRVSLETVGGAGLDLHWAEKRSLLDRAWDVVVLQGYSTLDRDRPGDGDNNARHAALLADMMERANPKVRVELVATWARADQVWLPEGHWYGKPIDRMAQDLQRGTLKARRGSRAIDGVVPVGLAWNRAFDTGLADPDPYDGIVTARIDLWAHDRYHASVAGYYLSALTIFGKITGRDPRSLGRQERAGRDLGLPPEDIAALQGIARETLRREGNAR